MDEKVKKAKRIIIIGNGFDLFQGLPTKFSDFIKFCELSDYYFKNIKNKKEGIGTYDFDKYRDKNNKIEWCEKLLTEFPDINIDENKYKEILEFEKTISKSKLIKYCINLKNREKYQWHDFENHLSKICNDCEELCKNVVRLQEISKNYYYISEDLLLLLDVLEFNRGCFFHDIQTLESDVDWRDYLESSISVTKKEFINILYTELKIFINAFNHYILHVVTKIPIFHTMNINCSDIDTLILNFNYTWNEKLFTNAKYNHIHGLSPDNNIVIGINNEKLGEEYLYLQKKFLRINLKTGLIHNNHTNEDYFDLDEWLGFCKFEKNKYDVSVIGHSLDKIDNHILEKIFKSDMLHSIYIYYWSEENITSLTENLYKLYGYETMNSKLGVIPNILYLPIKQLVEHN